MNSAPVLCPSSPLTATPSLPIKICEPFLFNHPSFGLILWKCQIRCFISDVVPKSSAAKSRALSKYVGSNVLEVNGHQVHTVKETLEQLAHLHSSSDTSLVEFCLGMDHRFTAAQGAQSNNLALDMEQVHSINCLLSKMRVRHCKNGSFLALTLTQFPNAITKSKNTIQPLILVDASLTKENNNPRIGSS